MSTMIALPDVLLLTRPGQVVAETELRSIRMQAALVRSLLEELDGLVPPSGSVEDTGAFAEQAVDELVHLACRMLETAAALAPERVAEIYMRRGSTPPSLNTF